MYVRDMRAPPDTSGPLRTLIAVFSLAVGRVLRRLRAETNADDPAELQTVELSRLEGHGWMTTADVARAELVKPQSIGSTLAELEREGLVFATGAGVLLVGVLSERLFGRFHGGNSPASS